MSSFVCADMIYVDDDDPNDPGSGAFSDPYRWIQRAIDSATVGDMILIRPGIYTGSGVAENDRNFNLQIQIIFQINPKSFR